MNLAHSRFLTSALHSNEFPNLKTASGKVYPEIVLAGRSNAGKSSFINALLQQNIAKTSATPGKTQRINFFIVDESFLLVDLPGYGYAKAPSSSIQQWGHAIDEYLNHRSSLKMLVLILDIRRTPSKEDLLIAKWAHAKNISLFLIFTKRDKLSENEVERAIQQTLAQMKELNIKGFLAVSNHHFYERKRFIQMLQEEMTAWA